MEILKILLLFIGWYFVFGFILLLLFELVISILKKNNITRDKVTAQYPNGVPSNLRYLFFFFWPYILYYVSYHLPKEMRVKNGIGMNVESSNFQSKLQEMAKENFSKKEDIKKSDFQTKLEKMADEKDDG